MLEWLANIPADVNRLHLARSEVCDFTVVVVTNKNNINVTRGLSIFVLQSDFNKRSPFCFWSEEKCRGILRN